MNDSITIDGEFVLGGATTNVEIDSSLLTTSMCNAIFETAPFATGLTIENMVFEGAGTTDVRAVDANGVANFTLHNIEVRNFEGAPMLIEGTNIASQAIFQQLDIHDNETQSTPVQINAVFTEIGDSSIVDNVATDAADALTPKVLGGALRIGGSPTDFAQIYRSDFSTNQADDGGALWTAVETNLTQCSFRDNVAVERGGAVYANGTAVRFVNPYVAGNQADLGGAIWANLRDVVIAYGTLIDNVVINSLSALIVGDDVTIGGSILDNGFNSSCQSSGTLATDDSVVTDDSSGMGATNTCVTGSSTNVLFSTTSGIDFDGNEARVAPTGPERNWIQRIKSTSDAKDHVTPVGGACPAAGTNVSVDAEVDPRPGSGDCDAGSDEES
jgi:predicted outer membrane repeat protein